MTTRFNHEIAKLSEQSNQALEKLKAAGFTTEQTNALCDFIDSQARAKAMLAIAEYNNERSSKE